MFKLIGYRSVKGEFEGRAYDNINLIVISDTCKNTIGHGVVEIKIKREDFTPITGLADDTRLLGWFEKELQAEYVPDGKYPRLISLKVRETVKSS